MSDYSITDHMASYDVYETPDIISWKFSVPRVLTYLLQSLDRLSISTQDK